MKHVLTGAARRVRDWLAHRGLAIQTVRGMDHWRAGMEVIWHAFDERTERVRICRIDRLGSSVKFLVRDAQDYIQSHYLMGNFYAEDELALIKDHYQGGAFLDIGANVGNHSLFAAKYLDAPRVFAVEPYPPAYQILLCNIALNGLEQRIRHFPIALSDHSGFGQIQAMEGNLGRAVMDEGGGDLPIATGDQLFADKQIGFIKIDVEGMEMGVLRGLEKTIRRCRPPAMIELEDRNRPEFEAFCHDLRYRLVHEARPYSGMACRLVEPV